MADNHEVAENDIQETAAADSLKPGAAPGEPMSKVEMMKGVMSAMAGMGKDDMVAFFNSVQAQFGPGKDYGVGDNSAKNAATIDAKTGSGPKTKDPMPKLAKEDVEIAFEGSDLSEETKEKVSTIFEAAVSARLNVEVARLEEQYEAALNEQVAAVTEDLVSKLDAYLDHVTENWMKENEVAIESALRNELMEEFIEGMKSLFAEHYIDVPESKIDVVEALAEKVQNLEAALNESIAENAEMKNFIYEAQKNELVEEISSDLALTQQEKFSALVEGIEFDGNLETFERKLKIIKENYFKAETYSSNIEEETFETESDTVVNSNPSVNRYVQALARTVKK